jgi:hypothetical protein
VCLLAGVLSRHSIRRIVNVVAVIFALGSADASAQQQNSSANYIALLARAICETGAIVEGEVDFETGYIAMLGVGEKAYTFRVLKNGSHTLMIPVRQCNEAVPYRTKVYSFVLSHSFQNHNQIREGYHYLMDQRGELLNAVHCQEGRSHLFAYANFTMPVRRADFEAEKAIWISRVAALTSEQ